MKKTIFCFLFLPLLCLPVHARASDSAKAAIVLHADSGEVLYAHDETLSLPMASTTKLMTALVTLEHCRLDETVTVSAQAAGTEGSSMYLRKSEELTVDELLYGLLLSSGNDAALALAEHCCGDVPAFIQLMNEKAEEIGLDATHYVNPNGLHDEAHYTTASDLARLMAVCLQNEDFCRISGCYYAEVAGRSLQNHNKLLKTCPGVFSGKTGYTMAAGRCLVSACERDGLRLICVTLCDRQDWNDHASLYGWAYENYEVFQLEKGSVQGRVPLIGGTRDSICAVVKSGFCRCIKKGTEVSSRLYLPSFVFAPVSASRELGALHLRMGEQTEIIPLFPAE